MANDSRDATSKPSAIYVWLVPSEEVLEQPGSWRIRKWDTEPFTEANFTLSGRQTMIPVVRTCEDCGADVYSHSEPR